jgi:hypothetical protein
MGSYEDKQFLFRKHNIDGILIDAGKRQFRLWLEGDKQIEKYREIRVQACCLALEYFLICT